VGRATPPLVVVPPPITLVIGGLSILLYSPEYFVFFTVSSYNTGIVHLFYRLFYQPELILIFCLSREGGVYESKA
jgi:hypothetical protein